MGKSVLHFVVYHLIENPLLFFNQRGGEKNNFNSGCLITEAGFGVLDVLLSYVFFLFVVPFILLPPRLDSSAF